MNRKSVFLFVLCVSLFVVLGAGIAVAKAKVETTPYVVVPCVPGLGGYPVYVTPENHVVARVHGNGWVYAPSVAYVTNSVALGYMAPQPVVYQQPVVYGYGYPTYPTYPGYPVYAPATLPLMPLTVVK